MVLQMSRHRRGVGLDRPHARQGGRLLRSRSRRHGGRPVEPDGADHHRVPGRASSAASSSRCTCRSSSWARSSRCWCRRGPTPHWPASSDCMIGSFLNVVIYRLPAMMHRDWLAESVGNLMPAEHGPSLWSLVFGDKQPAPKLLEQGAGEAAGAIEALSPLTLSKPRSRCRHLRSRDPLVREYPGAQLSVPARPLLELPGAHQHPLSAGRVADGRRCSRCAPGASASRRPVRCGPHSRRCWCASS